MSFNPRPGIGFAPPKPTLRRYPPLAYNIDLVIERYLPIAGEVLVAPGQRVDPDTPVGRCLLPNRPRLYNLAEYFDMPVKEAVKLVTKEVNTRLAEGEIVAQRKGGLRSKTLKAPFECILSAFDRDTSYISLTPAARPLTLEAYVRSVVNEIVPGWGVKLGLKATYVQGAFGFGGEQHGIVRRLVASPNDAINPAMIDARATYYILLGGSTVDAEVLRRAVEMKVRGIITGSIREEELTKFLEYRQRTSFYRVGHNNWRFPSDISGQDSPITLVLTEGFGNKPMASKVFEYLATQDSYDISINGMTRLRRGWQKPEIVAPVITSTDAARTPTNLDTDQQTPQVGSLVRLLNPGMLGTTARVINLPTSRRPSATLLLDRIAEVEILATAQRLTLPLVDLELLER